MRPLSKLLVAALAFTACGDNNKGKPDAGAPDAAPDAALPFGIKEAKDTPDGTGLTLAINFVKVTYVKPAVGNPANDPAGFTIQAEQDGTGLFIAVDPATLSPVPVAGDTVSFTITELATIAMQKRAIAISGFSRSQQGFDVAMLSTDISAATDVLTDIQKYESRLVTVTGTLGDFGSSGTGFQRSAIATAGLTDNNFQLRAPATLVDGIDMVVGCTVTAKNVPMGRFNGQAQVGAFSSADLTLTGCAAPTVLSVVTLSSTSVRVTFSRHPDPATVAANGSQFTFDNGLAASAAVVAGRTVTVTTSAQTADQAYTATIGTSIKDLQGTGLAAPGSGNFTGFVAQAVVRINEVNANVGGNTTTTTNDDCDMIELRVISGGRMTGYKIQERNGGNNELAFTFPAFDVATNDLIVVHMNQTQATCNANGATAETTAKDQQAAAAFAGNFDTAFDFWANDNGLTNTDNVFTLFDATGSIMDAVFISDDPAATATAAATETAAAAVGAANQWDPALATYIDAVFRMNAADDLNATGTVTTGNSIQRLNDNDTNSKADWSTGAGAANTFGALNSGQTAF